MMFKDNLLALFPIWAVHAERFRNGDVVEIAQATQRLHRSRVDKAVSQKMIVYMHANNSTKNGRVWFVALCF